MSLRVIRLGFSRRPSWDPQAIEGHNDPKEKNRIREGLSDIPLQRC